MKENPLRFIEANGAEGWELDQSDWPLIIGIEPGDETDAYVVATVESRDHGIAGQFHFDEATALAHAQAIAAVPVLIMAGRRLLTDWARGANLSEAAQAMAEALRKAGCL